MNIYANRTKQHLEIMFRVHSSFSLVGCHRVQNFQQVICLFSLKIHAFIVSAACSSPTRKKSFFDHRHNCWVNKLPKIKSSSEYFSLSLHYNFRTEQKRIKIKFHLNITREESQKLIVCALNCVQKFNHNFDFFSFYFLAWF